MATAVLTGRDSLLSRQEAAQFLGCKPSTLAAWACRGSGGPRVTKIGRLVKYRLSELQAYLDKQTFDTAQLPD